MVHASLVLRVWAAKTAEKKRFDKPDFQYFSP